jgi:hypothetical protein
MSKYLIYPCVLTDNDLELIKVQGINVSKCLIECSETGMKQKENINYHLTKVVMDIQEIVLNRNLKGYRYNSYLLNMIELKLTYVYELMRKLDSTILMREMSIIADSCFVFGLVLDSTYDVYKGESS